MFSGRVADVFLHHRSSSNAMLDVVDLGDAELECCKMKRPIGFLCRATNCVPIRIEQWDAAKPSIDCLFCVIVTYSGIADPGR